MHPHGYLLGGLRCCQFMLGACEGEYKGWVRLQVIRTFEFFTGKRSGRVYKFDVLITTFELVLKDAEQLGEIRWSYLVVDEAHRLKNNESALYRVRVQSSGGTSVLQTCIHHGHCLDPIHQDVCCRTGELLHQEQRCVVRKSGKRFDRVWTALQELSTWSFKNKLLVTGTPLQNSMRELWCLLHFLEPSKFPDAEEFERRHSLKEAQEASAEAAPQDSALWGTPWSASPCCQWLLAGGAPKRTDKNLDT